MTGRTSRADRRLELRLAVALLATVALGLPFLLLALLVRGRWEPLLRFDTSVEEAANELARSTDGLVAAMKVVAVVGDPNVFRAAAVVVAIWLFRRRRVRLAAWTLVTSLVGGVLSPLLKEVVGRARPALAEPVAYAGGQSFPSGHATGSMIGVGVLLLVLGPLLPRRRQRYLWAAGVAVVLLIGADRVILGVHYPSDVVAGWVVGLAWLAVSAAAFEAWRRDVGLPPSPPLEAEPDVGVADPRTG